MDQNFIDLQATAWMRYRKMHSGFSETVNGPGSRVEGTVDVREWLPKVFEAYDIKTMLDLPCGDWNWMQTVDLSSIQYEGWDIDSASIAQNWARFGDRGNVNFKFGNVFTALEIPAVDLIFCRDFLQHLPNPAIIEVLHKFIESDSRYLITNNYRESTNAETHCSLTGGHTGAQGSNEVLHGYYYRPVNLEAPPFRFGGRVESIVEQVASGEDFSEFIQELVLFDLTRA